MNFTPTSPCKVLVLHPEPLVRAGIVASLRQHVAFDVHESDAQDESAAPGPIDVVIADYRQAMREVDPSFQAERTSHALARTVIVTSSEREGDIQRALRAGVHGYVLLGGPLSELVEGVATVARGTRYLSLAVARRMADSLLHPALTARELEVLERVVAGESNKAIARGLNIEVGTVKTHLRAILSKLEATSRTQAANIAISRGLVDEPAPVPSTPLPPKAARPVLALHAGA
jgi:DNA-binding NarL/FixJ family response regulator